MNSSVSKNASLTRYVNGSFDIYLYNILNEALTKCYDYDIIHINGQVCHVRDINLASIRARFFYKKISDLSCLKKQPTPNPIKAKNTLKSKIKAL